MAGMNLLEYIADIPRRNALAEACGTSPDYLWQIATRWNGRKGSADLAMRIEKASELLGPEKVTKESIVFGDPEETQQQ